MASDLSGGLDPDFECFLVRSPDNPAMRDSASIWVMNDDGRIALPRVTIDAIGEEWERPRLQLNMVLADGRAFRVWSGEQRHPPPGVDGMTSVLGAGPLKFQCTEPFRRWQVDFRGGAEQTTTAAQMAGERGGEPVSLAFHLGAEMAAPPWLMGGMTAERARRMRTDDAGELMGGLRYEQLCRIAGEVRVGREVFPIAGTGMRVRRQGVRNMGAATGHCQHSALFPSGRAFGAIAFAPAADGSQPFNEGFIYCGEGGLIPATVVQAPWMSRLQGAGEDASLLLESAKGLVTIEGHTTLSTFDDHLFEMADNFILHQGAARYTWDGEQTIGLIERCTLRERLSA